MNVSIDPQSPMQSVLAVFPGAQRALFRRYHIGGCASCGFQPQETIAELCARNSLDAAEVLAHLATSHQQDSEMQIAPKELAALMQQEVVRLVDIRSREEFEATRIEGAVLFSQTLMQEILGHWSRTDLVVIYDHRGRQSLDAAAYFLGHHFTRVRCLRGGIDAWSCEVDAKVRRYELEFAS
jgi:rhodanese-related sulfurtransferase